MADSSEAGDFLHASLFSFPAATTKTTPSSTATLTAALRAADLDPPSERFAADFPFCFLCCS